MYLQTPQLPFEGEIIRQFNYRDGGRWQSVILVKLDNNPVTPFVCWVYDHTQRSCFWGHYGSRDFAEAKYHERVCQGSTEGVVLRALTLPARR